MERHGENALQVAQMLEAHPMIKQVWYPGLPSHPDHYLARKVFTSGGPNSTSGRSKLQTFGGMLAFIVEGDAEEIERRDRAWRDAEATRARMPKVPSSRAGKHRSNGKAVEKQELLAAE